MKNAAAAVPEVRLRPLFPQGLPRVVVFDCDGVLFDSREANIRFYDHILKRFGRPPVKPDQAEFVHMHSARESLEFLFGPDPELEEAWKYCQQVDFRIFNPYLKKEEGLEEFLSYLKSRCRVAVATNRTVSTVQLLESFGLNTYFDLVVTAGDVIHPKPHPELMERILTAFSVPPWQVLFIGDSQVDALFAENTGVLFAAYKNPHLRAAVHVDSFALLQKILSLSLD